LKLSIDPLEGVFIIGYSLSKLFSASVGIAGSS